MKLLIKIFLVLFLVFMISNRVLADTITVTINNPLSNVSIPEASNLISTPIYNSSVLPGVAVNIVNGSTIQDLIWIIPSSTPILKATYLPSTDFISDNTSGFASPNVPLICNTNQDISNYFRLPTGSIIFNGSCGPTPTPTNSPTPIPTPAPTPLYSVTTDSSLSGQGTAGSPLASNGAINPSNSLFGSGLVDDCATDNYAQIQAAIDYARTNATTPEGGAQSVSLPATKKCLKTSFPLWVDFSTAAPSFQGRFYGQGATSTIIEPMTNTMPGLFVAPADYTTSLSTANESAIGGGSGILVSSASRPVGSVGQAMLFDPSGAPWVVDVKSMFPNVDNQAPPFSGLSGFDIRGWIYITDTNNGDIGCIIDSNAVNEVTGARVYGPIELCYIIGSAGAANTMYTSFTTSAGNEVYQAVSSQTFNSTGGWVWYEASYDGAHYKVYTGTTGTSTLLYVANATGTTNDSRWTPLTVGQDGPGGGYGTTPAVQLAGHGIAGGLFGVQISNEARCTTGTVAGNSGCAIPTALPTCDANTLVQLNGTLVQSEKGTSSASGPFIAPECINGVPNPTGAQGVWSTVIHSAAVASQIVRIDDLEVQGGSTGILGAIDLDSSFDHLRLIGQYTSSLAFVNSNYGTQVNDVAVNSFGIYGIELMWGLMSCINCRADPSGGVIPFIDIGGDHWIQPFYQMANITQAGMVTGTQRTSLNSPELIEMPAPDDEGGSTGPSLVVGNVEPVTVIGGVETAADAISPVILDSNTGPINLTLQGVNFFGIGGNPSQWVDSVASILQGANYDMHVDFIDATFGSSGSVKNLLNNTASLVGDGLSYTAQPGTETIPCTTAGSYSWTLAPYTSSYRRVLVTLNGCNNVSQTSTYPEGGFNDCGTLTTLQGTCTNVSTSATTLTVATGGVQSGLCAFDCR